MHEFPLTLELLARPLPLRAFARARVPARRQRRVVLLQQRESVPDHLSRQVSDDGRKGRTASPRARPRRLTARRVVVRRRVGAWLAASR